MLNSLHQIVAPTTFRRAVLSSVIKKSIATYHKVTIDTEVSDSCIALVMTYHYNQAVVHKRYSWPDGFAVIEKLLSGYFKQAIVASDEWHYHILANKKGQLKVVAKTRRA